MLATNFYQTSDHNAITLSLVTPDTLEKARKISKKARTQLAAQQFKGQLGEVGIIANNLGHIEQVYLGRGKGTETQAIAHGVTRIPAGLYCSEKSWSIDTLSMWALAQYRFDSFKPCDKPARVLCVSEALLPDVVIQTTAIYWVRDLINTPANILGPEALANEVVRLAKMHDAKITQWVGEELLTHRFPAIHAVGRAAHEAPRLVRLAWGDTSHPKVTLVGKGVCFDSGGLDLKPSSNMRLMKKDMGGAAQVIGLAHWIMASKLPVQLEVLIPAVENAMGPASYRPGDILTMRNGLTVEIENTDAEGRLILADTLTLACEEPPELLIDFSTLTGAARVAVGTEISAFFTHDTALASQLTHIAESTHDAVWRLPLYAGYKSMLDSSIANLMNASSSSYAGATTAALFLDHFVTPGISWVHFDIMAWNINNKPGRPEGGEAMGIVTMASYLRGRYLSK